MIEIAFPLSSPPALLRVKLPKNNFPTEVFQDFSLLFSTLVLVSSLLPFPVLSSPYPRSLRKRVKITRVVGIACVANDLFTFVKFHLSFITDGEKQEYDVFFSLSFSATHLIKGRKSKEEKTKFKTKKKKRIKRQKYKKWNTRLEIGRLIIKWITIQRRGEGKNKKLSNCERQRGSKIRVFFVFFILTMQAKMVVSSR